MAELFEGLLECDGECGARIRVESRKKMNSHKGTLMSIAEVLGWKTVDCKQKTLVFCDWCQERAGIIIKGS
jgi:hypothetical protein